MMALMRGQPVELHGIQVGIGTLLTLKLWERLKQEQPSREKALRFIQRFDEAEWEGMVRRIFGRTAGTILKTARKEGRNDKTAHLERLDRTLAKWQAILQVVAEELPPYLEVYQLMAGLDMPLVPEDIGFNEEDTRDALLGAREIRNKYLTSSLMWDLGLLYDKGPEYIR